MFCQNKFMFFNEKLSERRNDVEATATLNQIVVENDTHGLTEAPSCGIIWLVDRGTRCVTSLSQSPAHLKKSVFVYNNISNFNIAYSRFNFALPGFLQSIKILIVAGPNIFLTGIGFVWSFAVWWHFMILTHVTPHITILGLLPLTLPTTTTVTSRTSVGKPYKF